MAPQRSGSPSLWFSGDILTVEVYLKNNYCFGSNLPPAGHQNFTHPRQRSGKQESRDIELEAMPGAFKYLS